MQKNESMRDYWVNKNCYFYRHIGLEVGLAYLLFLFQQWGLLFLENFSRNSDNNKKSKQKKWENVQKGHVEPMEQGSRKYLKYCLHRI